MYNVGVEVVVAKEDLTWINKALAAPQLFICIALPRGKARYKWVTGTGTGNDKSYTSGLGQLDPRGILHIFL